MTYECNRMKFSSSQQRFHAYKTYILKAITTQNPSRTLLWTLSARTATDSTSRKLVVALTERRGKWYKLPESNGRSISRVLSLDFMRTLEQPARWSLLLGVSALRGSLMCQFLPFRRFTTHACTSQGETRVGILHYYQQANINCSLLNSLNMMNSYFRPGIII